MRIIGTIAAFMLLLFLGLHPKATAQSSAATPTVDAVLKSIARGDANRLSQFFAERVELTLLDKRMVYSHQQARFVMADFFRKFPPTHFYTLHTGTSNSTFYVLGRYQSQRGALEVNLFLKYDRGYFRITQMRFGWE